MYDGPPFSGKTTTVRTLADRLGVAVETPEEERGRTLFYDWADYVGGLYDGRQIHCEIITVPGQRELAARREMLVETADVVIFVLDSRADAFDECIGRLQELLRWSREQSPPVGVVVQANKRDDPKRVPAEVIRERCLAIAPLAITETVATDGAGVRETFVLGVRLALDRVRASKDVLGKPPPPTREVLIESMSQLGAALERVHDVSAEAEPTDFEDPVPHGAERESAPPVEAEPYDPDRVPVIPDPDTPGGLIWPPVDGRILLHEVSTLGLEVQRARDGSWAATGAGWRARSGLESAYETADGARNAMLEWARRHSLLKGMLSRDRVLVAAPEPGGRGRLWQLVRTLPALRDSLSELGPETPDSVVAEKLLGMARTLELAEEAAVDRSLTMPTNLWTVGVDPAGRPVHVGLMSEPGITAPERKLTDVVGIELGPIVRVLVRQRPGLAAAFARAPAVLGHDALRDRARDYHREWHE
ncbi:MAG: hypothetical protein CMN30_17115 [Sandaracinus sp.]|nr:hypothetical protein [Sandaracinus sp.]